VSGDLDSDKVLYLFGALGYLIAWLALCALVIVLTRGGRR